MYLQHTDPIYAVPHHISRIGVYTAHTFLLSSAVAYKKNMPVMSCMLLGLYTTSVLHWRRIKRNGWIRYLDMFMVATTITRMTLVESYQFQSIRWMWLSTITTGLVAFYTNAKLTYNQIYRYNNRTITYSTDVVHGWFSMAYTNPNTMEREMAYYRNVIIHCIFQHIIPNVISIYAAFNS